MKASKTESELFALEPVGNHKQELTGLSQQKGLTPQATLTPLLSLQREASSCPNAKEAGAAPVGDSPPKS